MIYSNESSDYKNDGTEKKIVLINTDRKVESQVIKSYFKKKSDEFKIVHRYNQKRHSTNYYLQWAHFHWDINFPTQKKGQILSHMQGAEDIFDNKNEMINILKKQDKKTNYGIKSKDFLPITYTWDVSTKRVSEEEK